MKCTTRERNLNFACEGELVCQIEKDFVIPVFKDLVQGLVFKNMSCFDKQGF